MNTYKLISKSQTFLEFEHGTNSNSSKRFVEMQPLAKEDQVVVNEKIKKTKKKLVKVKDEIDLQKSMYSDCFENDKSSAVVKGKERQSELHQIAINDLLQVSQEIESFLTKLESAKKKLHSTWHGVGAKRPNHEINRRKRQNARKNEAKKKKRHNQGPLSFLNAVCIEPKSQLCFPKEFESMKESVITIKDKDLKSLPELTKVIKPLQQGNFYENLKEKKLFL